MRAMEAAMRARRRSARHGHISTVAAEASRGGDKVRDGDLEVSMDGGEASGGGGFGLSGHGGGMAATVSRERPTKEEAR